MKYTWRKTTVMRENILLCDNEGDYVTYHKNENEPDTLCISEQGKHYDNHAVALFAVANIEEAEYIVDRLVKVRTQ